MKKAFTLIELVISVVILSIMMLFLYKSYAGVNKTNSLYAQELQKIIKKERIKKTLYLDIIQANSITIQAQDKKEDVVFLQTKNSVHRRINPYVAYVLKEGKLYRLESLKEIKEYPFAADSEFVIDTLEDVEIFRLYKAREGSKNLYLLHMVYDDKEEILLKVKARNIKE